MRTTPTLDWQRRLLESVVLCSALLLAGPVLAEEADPYGFYRTVEGDVRLTTLDRAEPIDVEPDYPLLAGDRLWVAPGGRAEAILPDRTILRVGGSTDIHFESLPLSAAETAGAGTVIRLLEGELQVVVRESAWEGEPLRVDTANAVAYLERPGTYRIYSDDRQWTELVVREGFGEVVLAAGSIVARPNEEVVVDGLDEPRVRVYPAGGLDDLEAWGQELDRDARIAAGDEYVDESLHYEAASLRGHGEWVDVDAGHAWRPYSSSGWRPFTRGYWTHTPGGYYWVSSDPWGGFTSHYGSWSLHPYHGWVWYPGNVFSPAQVTWYWGPTHVAWIPSGYYSHHYRSRGYFGFGLRLGHYGWAGGSWGYYSDWTFCPTRYFGWRSYRSAWRSGYEVGRSARHDVPRGVITTTTRGIPRGFSDRPESLLQHLTRDRDRGAERKLPDVTSFVARRSGLSSEVREAVGARPASRGSLMDRATRGATSERTIVDRSDLRSRTTETTRRTSAIERFRSDQPTAARALPARPDLGRREAAAGVRVEREPQSRVPRGVEQSTSRSILTRERAPARPSAERGSSPSILQRDTTSSRYGTRSSGGSERPEVRTPASSSSAPSVRERTPIVRRVLDGIRGRTPSSSSREAPRSSASSSSSRSSASSRTSSTSSSSSRRPTPAAPSASRSSSSSSSRSSVKPPSSSRRSSSSSSKSSRSKARPRSQSSPKSKPPR